MKESRTSHTCNESDATVESRYLDLLQSVDGIVWEADAQSFNFTFVSTQAERLLGYAIEEWLTPGFWAAHLHPDDREWAISECTTATQSLHGHQMEYRFLAKDGRTVWLKDMVTVIAEAGAPCWLRGLMIDITTSKDAEIALREASRLNQYVIAGAQEGIIVYGSDLRYQVWNPYMEEITGMRACDVLGRTPLDVFPFLAEAGVMARLEAALAGEVPDTLEFPFTVTQSGRSGWAVDHSVPFRNEEGQIIGVIATVTEVTARREAEQILRENEARWVYALQGSGTGVWDWNLATSEAFLSKRWKEMLGFADHEIASSAEEWSRRVHPDDLPKVMKAIEDHLQGLTPNAMVENRLLCKDGSWLWVSGRGMVVSRDANGKPLRMVGTNTDISERKALEQELARQASTDELTGLFNRRHFLELADKELARVRRYGGELSLAIVDLDHFKSINDTYGHHMGDIVLAQFAALCRRVLRDTDVMGRIGGEEFAIFCPETSAPQVFDVAERLREEIFLLDIPMEHGMPIRISISVGLASLSAADVNLDVLLNRADQALYKAKNSGRNRICIAETSA